MPNEISITELNKRLKRLENLVSELLELAKLSSEATEDNKQKIQQLSRISESTNEAIQLITKRIECEIKTSPKLVQKVLTEIKDNGLL